MDGTLYHCGPTAGAAIFQVKNTDNDWAVQLNITSSGALIVNNRRNASDVTLTNPDGSTKDFDGQGFDVRIHDDGLNYKVWIDGVLYADNFYSRPTGGTQFRWGMYLGSSIFDFTFDYFDDLSQWCASEIVVR